VFYLAGRGADARPAVGRLRRDLEAVRRALASAQTAAQAAAVRESRLAALGLLRARLKGPEAEGNGPARAGPPGRLVYPALDVGAASESHSARELAYLPSACPPAAVLDRWERELHGLAEHEAGGKWNWDFLERYCRHLDLTGAAAQFLARHQEALARCRGAPPTADPATAEERERLLRWAEEHRELASRLERGARFVGAFQDFLRAAGERLLTPWRRALRTRQLLFFRRSAVPVTLSRAERAAIRNEATAGAVAYLEEAVQQGLAVRKRREEEFARALLQWRTWRAGGSWLAAVEQLEAQALQQSQDVECQSTLWAQGWAEAVRGVRVYLDRLEAILHVFDSLFRAKGAPDEITTRLTRAQREGLQTRTAEEAVGWLRENWPAPSERVEAVFALRQLGLASP